MNGIRSHDLVFGATRLFNRLVLPLAGTRLVPLYGILVHRGRRSGHVFRTPVVVRQTQDGFIVPMPWGDTTDWYRNIRAAGQCVVRWRGRDYVMGQPEVLDTARASLAFGASQRAALARFNIKQCLLLHHAAS